MTNNFRLTLTKGFCLLTKKPPCPLLPLPPPVLNKLTISKWIDRIPTKIKWKMHALSTLYFKFWRKFLCLMKICKIQTPDLYLLGIVCISFYISRNYFWQIFRTSFNIIWKKDFCHKFYFFNGFTQTSHLPSGQNLLSVTKVFCGCSLRFWIIPCQVMQAWTWPISELDKN